MTNNTRTHLALAACQGMTDAELAKRGIHSFADMIDRKRKYATAARTLKLAMDVQAQAIINLQAQLTQAQATIAALQAMDAPVVDTTQAGAMLASIMGTAKGSK